MLSLASCLSIICALFVLAATWKARVFLSELTLLYSWGWALAASFSVLISCALTAGGLSVSLGWRSGGQMLAAVMLLTPGVSTLGARKPGVAAWQWFVVAPMIIVLMWPGVSQIVNNRGEDSLELGVPAFAGIIVVLLMSAGTCLGTSLSLPFVLYSASIAVTVLPSTGWATPDSRWPLLAPLLLLIAAVVATRSIASRYRAVEEATTIGGVADQTWLLFQNLYGLAWARRVQDRVNQFAIREEWTGVLTADGFRDASGNPLRGSELEKPRDALRWVLGRFASEQWIARRLFRLG